MDICTSISFFEYIYIHIYIYVAQLFVAILMSKSNKYPIEAHIRHPGAMFFFYLGFGRIKVPNLTYLKKTPRLINFYLILNNNRTSLTTKIHDHFILKCWVFLSGGSIFRHRNDMCGCSESTLGSWFLQWNDLDGNLSNEKTPGCLGCIIKG